MKRSAYNLYKRPTKKGKVYYARYWSDDEQKYIRTINTGKTRVADAREVADRELSRGIVPQHDDPILSTYLESFWKSDSEYATLRKSHGTPLSARYIQLSADTYRLHIKPFESFSRVRVSQVDPRLVDAIVRWSHEKKSSPRQINIALQAILTPVRYWFNTRRVADSLPRYRKVKEHPKSRGVLTVEELLALRDLDTDKLKIDKRARVAVLLCGFCGLRLGEVRAIKYEDLDLGTGRLWVCRAMASRTSIEQEPKSGSVSEVPIPVLDFLVDAIHSPSEASPFGAEGYVLPTIEGNHPMVETTIQRSFFRMLQAIGIDKEERKRRRIVTHSLRHTAVSFWQYTGLPQFVAQGYARHKAASMTEHYSHAEIISFEQVKKKIAKATRSAKPKSVHASREP